MLKSSSADVSSCRQEWSVASRLEAAQRAYSPILGAITTTNDSIRTAPTTSSCLGTATSNECGKPLGTAPPPLSVGTPWPSAASTLKVASDAKAPGTVHHEALVLQARQCAAESPQGPSSTIIRKQSPQPPSMQQYDKSWASGVAVGEQSTPATSSDPKSIAWPFTSTASQGCSLCRRTSLGSPGAQGNSKVGVPSAHSHCQSWLFHRPLTQTRSPGGDNDNWPSKTNFLNAHAKDFHSSSVAGEGSFSAAPQTEKALAAGKMPAKRNRGVAVGPMAIVVFMAAVALELVVLVAATVVAGIELVVVPFLAA